MTRVPEANRFLREQYVAEFNRRFQLPAAQPGSAFTRGARRELERVFSLQFERAVNRDSTVSFQNLILQIEPNRWRGTLAGCNVIVHQHLDGTLSITYGPHRLGHYTIEGLPIRQSQTAPRGAARELLRRMRARGDRAVVHGQTGFVFNHSDVAPKTGAQL
jgi:hypothetical protein